ncbi:hypothetical protein DRP04_10530 [Archaeoglobales archaeon]|nr:MAG: hypothetical protein DRP04_10530 [Archaeoglobales archaeon]
MKMGKEEKLKKMLSKLESIRQMVKDFDAELSSSKEYLREIASAIKNDDFGRAEKLIDEVREAILQEMKDYTLNSVREIKNEIEKLKLGVNPDTILSPIFSELERENFREAKKRAEDVREVVVRLSNLIERVNGLKESGVYIDDVVESIHKNLEQVFHNPQRLDYVEALLEQKVKVHEQFTEAIENAKKEIESIKLFGCDVSTAERILREAEETRNYEEALKKVNKAVSLAREVKSMSRPEIDVELPVTEFRLNVFYKTQLIVSNVGRANAKEIEIIFPEEVDVKNLEKLFLKAGERKKVDIGIKAKYPGDIPLNITVSYMDLDGKTYKSEKRFWIRVYDEPTRTPDLSGFPSELLDDYTYIGLIGCGGFGCVYKVKRKKDGEVVALKIPNSRDPSVGKAFLREITVWRKLKHRNIVEVYDVNVLPVPYVEMECCDSSLEDLQKPVDVEKAAWLIFNIAEGLKYAHSENVIHRDLKPKNIMIKDGIPKISDWGLCRVATSTASSTSIVLTPLYAAPEQISGRFGEIDKRTDIWQLGVIFYELVTGEQPFKAGTVAEIGFAIVKEDPVPPSKINPAAEPVEHVIMKCLRKEQEERYQSVNELQKDLAKYLGLKYQESLKKSMSTRDFTRSAYYCGELLLIYLRIGDLVQAYKYAVDLTKYAKGDIRNEVERFCTQLKYRIEENIPDVPEELVKLADIIVHRVRVG